MPELHYVATPDPVPSCALSALTTDALEAEITTLAANIAVATWRLLKLIAELERRDCYGNWGIASGAHWLNWKCGIDLGAAREKVRVALALEALPQIDEAFASGTVSYSKVRAMTRVATPENEDYLLMIARHGTAAHVETLVRGYRRARRLEAACNAYSERSLSWDFDDDGSITIRARLPAEQGALVLNALQAAVSELRTEREGRDRDAAQNVSAETSAPSLRPEVDSFDPAQAPVGAWRADALCHIAEQFLANDTVPVRQAERYQVVVHLQDSARPAADVEPPACCRIEHGPALATETARRIACDAALVRVAENHTGNVLDIGRRTRAIPPAIRRALERRDGGCRFPGCLNHRHVDAHHIRHWADGGETRIGNLVLLCRHHHRLLHEFGFRIESRDDGTPLFFRPDGQLIPHAPVPPQRRIETIARDCGASVSAETCLSLWEGESMDLHHAVRGLMSATNVPVVRAGSAVGA